MSLQQTKSDTDALRQAAQASKTADEFIYAIQRDAERAFLESDDPRQQGLLTDLYSWEYSTPENESRFKHSGWFSTAATYWRETSNP